MITSLCCFSLAVALYGISQLIMHGKLRWMKDDASFWGDKSHLRKWIFTYYDPENPNKPYKKERWPTSSTLTVFLTDGYHLMQFLFTILFCISAVSYEREFGFWIDLGVYWGSWKLVFWAVYNSLQRKK